MMLRKDLLKEWWVWVIALMGLILWLSSCTKPIPKPEPVETYETLLEKIKGKG